MSVHSHRLSSVDGVVALEERGLPRVMRHTLYIECCLNQGQVNTACVKRMLIWLELSLALYHVIRTCGCTSKVLDGRDLVTSNRRELVIGPPRTVNNAEWIFWSVSFTYLTGRPPPNSQHLPWRLSPFPERNLTTMAERPGYCIPPHCGLCRFRLDDGDVIVVGR